MESHTLELFPDRGQVHLALFRNVTNAAQLRERLLSQDDTLSCALIDASLVNNAPLIRENRSSSNHPSKKTRLSMYFTRYSQSIALFSTRAVIS